jgi:hypothetical protein
LSIRGGSLTFNPQLVPLNFILEFILFHTFILLRLLHKLFALSLLRQYMFQLLVSHPIHANLLLFGVNFSLQFKDCLSLTRSVTFDLTDRALELSAVLLLTHSYSLESLKLAEKFISLLLCRLQIIILFLQLPCDMVDVSLQGQNLRHKLFFFLLETF